MGGNPVAFSLLAFLLLGSRFGYSVGNVWQKVVNKTSFWAGGSRMGGPINWKVQGDGREEGAQESDSIMYVNFWANPELCMCASDSNQHTKHLEN